MTGPAAAAINGTCGRDCVCAASPLARNATPLDGSWSPTRRARTRRVEREIPATTPGRAPSPRGGGGRLALNYTCAGLPTWRSARWRRRARPPTHEYSRSASRRSSRRAISTSARDAAERPQCARRGRSQRRSCTSSSGSVGIPRARPRTAQAVRQVDRLPDAEGRSAPARAERRPSPAALFLDCDILLLAPLPPMGDAPLGLIRLQRTNARMSTLYGRYNGGCVFVREAAVLDAWSRASRNTSYHPCCRDRPGRARPAGARVPPL